MSPLGESGEVYMGPLQKVHVYFLQIPMNLNYVKTIKFIFSKK